MFDITVEYQPNPEAIGAIHEGLKAFNETHRFTSTRYGLPKGCADKGSAVSYCEGLRKYPSPTDVAIATSGPESIRHDRSTKHAVMWPLEFWRTFPPGPVTV